MSELNQQHALFPVSLSARWQSPTLMCETHQISANLRDWLLDPSSLTKRLKAHAQTFRVELLGQAITQCTADEATDDISAGDEVLIREVLLFCDDQPHVFARSLLPITSLTGEEKQLATLGCQSLGQVLFNSPNLIRKGIELAAFQGAQTNTSTNEAEPTRFQQLINSLNLPSDTLMMGRRSTFLLNSKPIMVAEVFLPHAHAYQVTV